MKLHFEPITSQNRAEAIALCVAQGQESFIESVADCLSEADEKKLWRPVGIYDGSTIIGFAMYGFFFWEYFPAGRLWLDRFLIDGRFQGKGYGRAALEGLLDLLARQYPRRKVFLSVYQSNAVAIRLYEQFGFRFNGEKDIHGEDVMVTKRNTAK